MYAHRGRQYGNAMENEKLGDWSGLSFGARPAAEEQPHGVAQMGFPTASAPTAGRGRSMITPEFMGSTGIVVPQMPPSNALGRGAITADAATSSSAASPSLGGFSTGRVVSGTSISGAGHAMGMYAHAGRGSGGTAQGFDPCGDNGYAGAAGFATGAGYTGAGGAATASRAGPRPNSPSVIRPAPPLVSSSRSKDDWFERLPCYGAVTVEDWLGDNDEQARRDEAVPQLPPSAEEIEQRHWSACKWLDEAEQELERPDLSDVEDRVMACAGRSHVPIMT